MTESQTNPEPKAGGTPEPHVCGPDCSAAAARIIAAIDKLSETGTPEAANELHCTVDEEIRGMFDQIEWGVRFASGRVWVPTDLDPAEHESFCRRFALGTQGTLVWRAALLPWVEDVAALIDNVRDGRASQGALELIAEAAAGGHAAREADVAAGQPGPDVRTFGGPR